MIKRQWLGRSLWLAVWLGWAYFGYWLYLYLPRTFVSVCELPVEPGWPCLGFIGDTQLVAYRMHGLGVGGREDPIAVFDAVTGAAKEPIRFADRPSIGERFELSVESGLTAVAVPRGEGDARSGFGIEIVDLTSDERQILPGVTFSVFDDALTFHRSLRWVGAFWKEFSPSVRRRVAVYDADAKAFLFDSVRPDEDDPSTYFVGAPIFVDGARRFAVSVGHRDWAKMRLDLWDIPENGKPRRTYSAFLDGEIANVAGRIHRITADNMLIVLAERQLVYCSLDRRCIDARIACDDMRFRFLVQHAGSIAVDPDNRRCLRTDEIGTQWKWPTEETMVWHDGRRVCWMEDAVAARTLGRVHRHVPAAAKALRLYHGAFVLRDLTTGRFRCRAFMPEALSPPNAPWGSMLHSLMHGDRNGKYFVTASGKVYHAEPRPLWGLISAAQAILAAPLSGVWLFRRWRRRRARIVV